MEFLEFISKHNKLYNIDQEYTTTIDEFLYDNLKEYVMEYESEYLNVEIERSLKEPIDINEQHKLEIQTLTNNYESIIEHYKTTHEEELDKIRHESNELLKKELELEHVKELNQLNSEHDKRINELNNEHNKVISNLNSEHNKAINDLNNEHNNKLMLLQKEIADLKSTSSIKLGCKAEQDLKELFISMGKNCVDKHKTNHVADLWIIDDDNKILYVIESKNKGRILSDDLIKFKNDLEYISKNIKPNEFKNYELIGLFISTRGDAINSEIGSFSFNYYETYISQQFISIEFFKLYFKSIETLVKLKNTNSNYDSTLTLITNEYNSLRSLIEMCEVINKNANTIITTSNNIKEEITNKINKFENTLVEINSPKSSQIEIETKIKNYIKTNPKFTVKEIKRMTNGYNIFNGKKFTRQSLIAWANASQ